MKEYKILILAGGGCFGYIETLFLERVNFSIKDVDIIAGTSIGGILSLLYSSRTSSNLLVSIFEEMATKVFKTSFLRSLNPFSSKYSEEPLEEFLKKHLYFKFKYLTNPVVITSVDFHKHQPKVFDNIEKDSDLEWYCWEIARATSAAPTYFPPYGRTEKQILIDGGIFENIPIVTTITTLKSKMNLKNEQMKVFVIGSGQNQTDDYTIHDVKRFSKLNWLNTFLIPYVTNSNEMASHFWAQNMDLKSYRYFNPVILPHELEMDQAELVGRNKLLYKKAEKYFDNFEREWESFLH